MSFYMILLPFLHVLLRGLTVCAAVACAPLAWAQPSFRLPTQAVYADVFRIENFGSGGVFPPPPPVGNYASFFVDTAGMIEVRATGDAYPVLNVQSPSGVIYNASTVEGLGGQHCPFERTEAEMGLADGTMLIGKTECYKIDAQEVGEWRFWGTESLGNLIAVHINLTSPIRTACFVTEDIVRDSAVITVAVFNGQAPVLGANVSLEM